MEYGPKFAKLKPANHQKFCNSSLTPTKLPVISYVHIFLDELMSCSEDEEDEVTG